MSPPRVFNLGSLNLDVFLHVSEFVGPGETLPAISARTDLGGKGLNQSIALARAGAKVHHIGAIGPDGDPFMELLSAEGVNVSSVKRTTIPSGTAFIQINKAGENAIVVHAGANGSLAAPDILEGLGCSRPGDWFLCQNETSSIPAAIEGAAARGLYICFNAAPTTEDVSRYPLELVNLLVLNEDEAGRLTGSKNSRDALSVGAKLWPATDLVITRGARGVICRHGGETLTLDAFPARSVDTTAAGDTFVGFLLAGLTRGLALSEALVLAARAAARTVETPGASSSIPHLSTLT